MNVVSLAKRLFALSLASLLLLAACSQDAGTPEIVPSLVPLATVTAEMAATAEAAQAVEIGAEAEEDNASPNADSETDDSAADQPQPTPTEPAPPETLAVSDQELSDEGQLLIDRVEAAQPGWVVIHGDENGAPGDILGYAEIAEGTTENLAVEVDPLQATPRLYAMLHVDEGEFGAFESPGPDRPVQVDGETILADFTVEISVRLPSLAVNDQVLTEEETIIVDSAVLTKPGWIALQMDEDGEPGQMLSYLPLEAGETQDVALGFNWRIASPMLHVVLYEDAGQPDVFEDPEVDAPVQINGQPVAQSFQVILPPDIFVLDQPVIDGEIVVERAISYGPGWVVIYHDDAGGLGNIIGWAQLVDGINEDIRFPVVESAVTPVLHAMIHEDLETVGEFGFPRTDPPLIFRDRVPNPVSFRTDTGNYLITRDQTLSASETVTVSLVVVDVDAFVVIRVDEEGESGEIIGLTSIPAGVSREVSVELETEVISGTLYAELFLDANSDEELDYPDGLDIPMQRNRAVIRAPFTLLPEDER